MYNLFPLMAGHLLLPKLSVNMVRYPGTIDPIVQKMLPSHVFIKVKLLYKGETLLDLKPNSMKKINNSPTCIYQ